MRKIIASSVCLLALMGSMAQAEDGKGKWYLSLEGAYSLLEQETARGSVLDIKNRFNDGWAIGGIVGYDSGQWRLEGEIGKHFHNADRFNISNDNGLGLGGLGNVAASSGKARLTNYMMNAVFDFGEFSGLDTVEPFIGAGLGVADMNLRDLSTTLGGFVNDTDMVFAYQAFAGVRIPLAEAFEMSFKYRYLATADGNMVDRIGNNFKASYDVHDFVVGVTYRFGGGQKNTVAQMPQPIAVAMAEPAPVQEAIIEEPVVKETTVAPEPMPEPAAGPVINMKPYVVYFDWDSSQITSEGFALIQEAAIESQKANEIAIVLTGHTDRSGTEVYNDKLAMKRTDRVKNALVNAGVEGTKISIESFGERQNDVDTDDGVKEARNRRVSIVLK
ncbi:MAG: outer membrane beta-barrel protein [Emcibacter sp.]|nr:outer membrane beta-barrel protein [Emcibacter sp.]